MHATKVLLVDDEEEFTSILSERMETRGLSVQTAADGKTALELIKKSYFDVVVLDMSMPEMDGIETLKRLLKITPDIQVIMLTGHATLQKGVEAVKLGAVDFLEKPADFESLLSKIKDAQGKRRLSFEQRLEESISEIVKKKGW